MSMQTGISALKQQFEQLFPGKWLPAGNNSRQLSTGLAAFDNSIARGIARRRITEWVGPLSSGKTSVLRQVITSWCAKDLNVAYVDAQGRLLAADWAFVDRNQQQGQGKFWIVRPNATQITRDEQGAIPLVGKQSLDLQEALWSADQFIRVNAFDVVILDLGGIDPYDKKRQGMSYSPLPSRMYARLQRCLDKSKTALVIVRDGQSQAEGWGCHARFSFDWGASIVCQAGLAGLAMITPSVKCKISKDGISQLVEVELGSSVQNRLFTHPRVPDRRTSKR